jgi:hypothetical protein
MGDGSTLRTGLKEWSTVCRSLERGRQIFLLRKGGIYESAGEFEVEHRRFVLFRTYVHQKREMLKPEVHGDFEPRAAEPERVELRCWCEVSDIVEVRSRERVDALGAEHVWTPPLIVMRFNYRPENPLYLLVVRTFLLHEPVTIENTIAYAGCKSWVPLERAVDVSDSRAALPHDDFARRRGRVLETLACASKAGAR